MHSSIKVFLINDSVRAIQVQYKPGEKDYTFKTVDPLISKDDMVVVPTDTRHNYTVCKVTDVDTPVDFDMEYEVKWIVDRVDIEGHKERLEMENSALTKIRNAEARRKRAELYFDLVADGSEEELKQLPIFDRKE